MFTYRRRSATGKESIIYISYELLLFSAKYLQYNICFNPNKTI